MFVLPHVSLITLQIAVEKRPFLDVEFQRINFLKRFLNELKEKFSLSVLLSEQLNSEFAENYLLTTFVDISLQLFHHLSRFAFFIYTSTIIYSIYTKGFD